jgi:hypothetical protein
MGPNDVGRSNERYSRESRVANNKLKLHLIPAICRAKNKSEQAFVNSLVVSAARAVARQFVVAKEFHGRLCENGSTRTTDDLHPICWLFIHSRKGYKLPFLKRRFYGEEEEKAACVDFRRGPRSEDNGAQENQGVRNCQEAAANRRRHATESVQHRALARFPFLTLTTASLLKLPGAGLCEGRRAAFLLFVDEVAGPPQQGACRRHSISSS